MKKCNFCGTDNQENTLFCEWCGKRLSDEFEEASINLSFPNGDEVKSANNAEGSATTKNEVDMEPLKLQVGGLYDGKVTRILPIGAFVELAPGRDGLVHISKLADYRVERVEDVVNVGDMIWVKITEIDEKGRINLSRKDAMREIEIKQQSGIVVPSTYHCSEVSEQQDETDVFRLQVGELYDGKVTRILPIGAFVELAPGRDGLVHISKLADYRVERVEDVVNVGDMIWVKITEIDEKGRINLSRKDAMREIEIKRQNGIVVPSTYHGGDESEQQDETSPKVGCLYKGKVTRILPIGAFVELSPGKDGLVHISKLADYRIEKVEDVVSVGDMIWVKITEIDEKGRINLSHKDALREIEIKRQNGEIIG